jgi:hypothetical protein
MTVKQLIKQLQKLPQNVRVGVSHHDNYEYEVAGWINSVQLHDKSETDTSGINDAFDREAFEGHPERWVTLHC